jgi:hypothetical protein
VKRVAAFGRFWWNFVVGDDWLAAFCIAAAIGATAGLAATSTAAWWVMPLAVAATLSLSVRRALSHRASSDSKDNSQ